MTTRYKLYSLLIGLILGATVAIYAGNGPIANLAGTTRARGTVNALSVELVDGSGMQVTSFGGGTQYTEDAAAAANPEGNATILVRADTPGGVTTANGDNVAQRGTDYGAAYVQLVTSSGSYIDSVGGGTQYTEGDSDSTITGTAIMFESAANTLGVVNTSQPLPVQLIGTGVVDTEMATAVALGDNLTPANSPFVFALCYQWDSVGGNADRCSSTDLTVGSAYGATVPGVAYSYKDFDGSALPTTANVNTEEEAVPPAATLVGVAYGFLVNENGSKELGHLEDDAVGSGDYGAAVWYRRIDSPASSAGASGDYAHPDADENGGAYVTPIATNAGGATTLKYTAAGSTEDKHNVCTGPCNIYSITATNHTATGVFLRCENDTSGNTTPGSETPELDLEIPGDASGRGFSATFPTGAFFSAAATCWIVLGEADTDVAEVGANDVKLFYTFKQ